MQELALDHGWARKVYGLFGRWLLDRCSEDPALPQIFARHFPFFERLDATFDAVDAIQGNALLKHFRASELRRYLLSVRFLTEAGLVDIDEESKLERAESDRIADTLVRSHSEPWGPMLARYAGWLTQSNTSKLTVRLYVSTAASLCRAVGLADDQPYSEEQLRQYLRKHPGARANLFRWLTFCRHVFGWEVRMPPALPKTSGRLRVVNELAVLLRKIEEVGLEGAPIAEMQRVVAKAFCYPPKQLDSPEWSVEEEGDHAFLRDSQTRVRVPKALRDIVLAWARRRHPDVQEPQGAVPG